MNIKKIISLLITMVLLMAVPFASFAEEDEDYCCDESAFVWMTSEEVSAELLSRGIGFDKIVLYSVGAISDRDITVTPERDQNRIEVFFYTTASMVANEIGIKSLKFYENGILLKTNTKIYTGFKSKYTNGYYYYAPVSGRKYNATGTNFALFTNTEVALFTESDTITY